MSSGFDEYQTTGAYPLRPDLGDRCAAAALSVLAAGTIARIHARQLVEAKALRQATSETRTEGRGRAADKSGPHRVSPAATPTAESGSRERLDPPAAASIVHSTRRNA